MSVLHDAMSWWMRYRLSTLHLITLFKTYLDSYTYTYTYSTKALSL
jgi:hypothetical protein